MKIKSYEDFLNESVEFHNPINEGEVNYRSDKFAIIFIGGSIGQRNSYPIFCKGQMGSIYETGNDKDALKETASRLRKQLSPGEKKYYGMSYTVIELTPYKIKEIEYLISKQQETANESSENVNPDKISLKEAFNVNKSDNYKAAKDIVSTIMNHSKSIKEEDMSELLILLAKELEGGRVPYYMLQDNYK